MNIFWQVDGSNENKVDTQCTNQGNAAAQRETTEKHNLEGVWIKPDEAELAYNNLRTSRAVKITHPGKGGPILI